METSQEKTTRNALPSGTASGLFFLLLYFYLWWIIDPRLVFQGLGILAPYRLYFLHLGWPFFLEHLTRAGGVVEYGVRLLSQFFAFGWAGALVVTAAGWFLGLFSARLSRRGGHRAGSVLRCAPAAMVLVAYCGYSHPLSPVLSLLAALAGHALYVRLAPAAPAQRAVAIPIACLAMYYVAGSGSLLLPVLIAVDELLIGKRRRLAAVAFACALAVPVAAYALSGLDLKDAYMLFLISILGVASSQWPHVLALSLFFPTLLAASVLWGGAGASEAPPDAKTAPRAAGRLAGRYKGRRWPAPKPRSRRFGKYWAPAGASVFFCGVAAVAWLSLDSRARTVLETDYYAQREQWADVLRSAVRMPKGTYNHRYNRNVIQALYHTGRLADELFRYPQRGVDLFSTSAEHEDLGSDFQESRLFLDVGQVNRAERAACEALATSGEQPAILEQLAVIHAAKDRPQTARVFLNTLAKHPFHRRAAREAIRRLEADPALENDRRASRIRRNMPSRDTIVQVTSVEESLQALLEKNPRNQMAFELLMAHYLCSKQPEKVVENLPRLKDFSYPRIPRYYQEALVVHTLASNRSLPPEFEIDPEVLWRARDFQRIAANAASPAEVVMAALEAGLGDSYFLYFAFGISGW